MASTEKLGTDHKALTLNREPSTFGFLAEMGAKQGITGWFLVA
jgi:hypothetical protein